MATTTAADTYFYLLENPNCRELGLTGFDIRYVTSAFDQAVYERATGKRFVCRADAYQDWVSRGRSEGYEWAKGKDTLLKIILKAKDEPELIDAWITHHARIVGLENLVILDCGSEDPSYLEKLSWYSRHILTFTYKKYYNDIHATKSNSSFFKFIARNTKYVAILDADEFLVGRYGDYLSPKRVKGILREEEQELFCCTWLNCTFRDSVIEGKLPSGLLVDTSSDMIRSGTVAGKSIARSNVLFDIGHLGHNLHVSDVMKRITSSSFGKLFVLHLKGLGEEVTRRRVIMHLIGKGAIQPGGEQNLDHLERLLADSSTRPDIRKYAAALLDLNRGAGKPAVHPSEASCEVNFPVADDQLVPGLSERISHFDFQRLLVDRLVGVGG